MGQNYNAHSIYARNLNGHCLWLQSISYLGLNDIIFLNVLEQSLADKKKNHSLKISFVITIIIMSQLGFEQKLFWLQNPFSKDGDQ